MKFKTNYQLYIVQYKLFFVNPHHEIGGEAFYPRFNRESKFYKIKIGKNPKWNFIVDDFKKNYN